MVVDGCRSIASRQGRRVVGWSCGRWRRRPTRWVAADAQDALQAERGHALLLVDHLPDRGEPADQRRPSPREDRARRHRRFSPTSGAAPQPVGHLPPAAIDRAAEPAREPISPPQPLQKPQARPVIREPLHAVMVKGIVDLRTCQFGDRSPNGPGRLLKRTRSPGITARRASQIARPHSFAMTPG